MRSTPSRRRLDSTCRRIRAAPRPRSPPSSIGLNVFVAITTRSRTSAPFVASHAPMYSSLCPPPYASAVSRVVIPRSHAASRSRNASSREVPWPNSRGAEPTPPKLPQPRITCETATPLRPSARCSTRRSYAGGAPDGRIGLAPRTTNTGRCEQRRGPHRVAGGTARGGALRRDHPRRECRARPRQPAGGMGAVRVRQLVDLARDQRAVRRPRRDVLDRSRAHEARGTPTRARDRPARLPLARNHRGDHVRDRVAHALAPEWRPAAAQRGGRAPHERDHVLARLLGARQRRTGAARTG